MNKIALPRDFIYEFQLDKGIVSNYLGGVLLQNLNYKNSGNEDQLLEYASPIPYDEKIFNEIDRCLSEVSSQYIKVKLKLCDAWLTKTEMLKTSLTHDHSLSIFSGVLYLNDHDTDVIFYVPDEFASKYNTFLGNLFQNNRSQNILRVKPSLGKLIIWPSYILHKVSGNNTKNIRYSLAFNSFLDGEISIQETQKLHLRTEGPKWL